MKSCRILVAAVLVLMLSACQGGKAKVDCTVKDAPSEKLVISRLNGTMTEVLDTVRTDAAGRFTYKLNVQKACPEFFYIYRGGTRIASILLEKGESVVVEADTLGNYEVSGSDGSILLKEGDDNFRAFVSNLYALSDAGAEPGEIAKEYIRHYREAVKFVMVNNKSLAVIPVLYENIGGSTATFSGTSDALIFRSVCDSLKTVYPDSKYVKALDKEAQRRINLFDMSNRLSNAEERAYPPLRMPALDGSMADIDSLGAKVTLIYFWDDREASHKMFNLDVLKPVYDKYKARGLEIYGVGVNSDKVSWAQTVKAQELPWVNVNDGLGTASRSLYIYNVQSVPAIVLVSADGTTPVPVSERPLRAALDKALR